MSWENPNPEFIVFCGPMFSGKTSRLLSTLDRFAYQKKRIIVFKPKMDDRYSRSAIVTHTNQSIAARSVSNGKDILREIVDGGIEFDVIAVDEAFMLDGIAEVMIQLYKLGKTVVISSLEMSATCNQFDEITKMMSWATQVEKCVSVCTVCQRDASFTQRKISDMNEIQVGGADMYEPRCWRCHESVNDVME